MLPVLIITAVLAYPDGHQYRLTLGESHFPTCDFAEHYYRPQLEATLSVAKVVGWECKIERDL